MYVDKDVIPTDEIDRVLVSRGKRLRSALLPLEQIKESWVAFGNLDKFVVLQIVEGGVDRETRIDRVLSLGQAVVRVEYTACGQVLEGKLSACVHVKVELDWAIEYDYDLIIDLLVNGFVHVVENAALFFDLGNANVGQFH